METLVEMELNETAVEVENTVSFNVEHEALMNILTICAKVVPKSASIPILQCVKFDLNGNTLFVTATDTTQSILQMLEVENEDNVSGSYLFPAKEGIELVKRLPHGKLTFTKKGTTVYINYGTRGKANLKVLNSDEYPQLPMLGQAPMIKVPIEVLRKGAVASKFSLSDEKTPVLTGINVINHEGKLGFVATDRHRIYRYVSDVRIEQPETFVSAIITASSFKQIVDSLKTDQVELGIINNYLMLRDKSTVYFGRLIEGTFPDISRIFSGVNQGTSVNLSRGELDDTLNRALSLDATNNRVTLEVNEQGVFTLHTQSENSELCEEFPNAKVGDDFPLIKFNGRYLRDALMVGDREAKNTTMHVSGIGAPGFITLDGDSSVCVVVNPVR